MISRRQDDPHALRLPPASPEPRRRQVGMIALGDAAVRRFNQLLARVAPDAPPVSADQLVTLARWLLEQPQTQAEALLSERLGRADGLRRMIEDADWQVGEETRERIHLLTHYLQQVDDLIPDHLPRVGHLDDALLVELAWPSFADEARDYTDYCRFRSAERPRGSAAERRLAWETACLAEAALLQRRRDVRARHYVASPRLPDFLRVI